MKKYLIATTYLSIFLGILALFCALGQRYQYNQHDHNVERIVNEGIRLRAVVVAKRVVATKNQGIYSWPKGVQQNRVYAKIIEPPYQGKIVWGEAHPEINDEISVGATVHTYIKNNDVFIEELKYTPTTRGNGFLLASLGLLFLAVISHKKAKKYPRLS